ncbi:MAG: hypothetical protein CMJ46_11550 [Planctomyces sp.]|nr:hypothetical protein [Planctomyces sp.]
MTDYSFIQESIQKYPDLFHSVAMADRSISQIVSAYPNIPVDYVEFLRQFGSIQIETDLFTIYGQVLLPGYIFGEGVPSELSSMIFIGDDFSGDMTGFNTDNWQLIEYRSGSGDVLGQGRYDENGNFEQFSFKQFIEDWVSRAIAADD